MGSLLQNLQSGAGDRYGRLLVVSITLFLCAALNASVTDRAPIFSKATRQKLNTQNEALKRYYKAGLKIDTYATAPGLSAQGDTQPSTPEFNEWLRGRAEKGGRDNVYVLVVKDPPYLMVSVGQRLRERDVFPRMERDMLMRLLAARFQRAEFDKGILEGMALLRDTLSNRIDGTEIPTYSVLLRQQAATAELRKSQQQSPGSYLHWIGLILVLVFGIWLAVNIFQTLATKAKQNAPIGDGT